MDLLDPTTPSDFEGRGLGALAPRVDSLDGKRIGLYDDGKMAAEPLLTVLERTLAERHPDSTFSWHAMAVKQDVEDPETLAAVGEWAAAELDVCIGAIGDCGSCTKYLTWGMQAVEEAGVPSVGLVDEGFVLDWQSNAVERGLPLRYDDRAARSELRDEAVIEERLTPAVVEGIEAELTRPLTARESGVAPR